MLFYFMACIFCRCTVLLFGSKLGFRRIFLPLESIQSHSPGLFTPSTQFFGRPTRVDNAADNDDINQLPAANPHRLLSHVTLGLVECRK